MSRKSRGRVLFVASVYSHLARFHKPLISFLQDKGYEVHAAARPETTTMEEIGRLGVACWSIPFSRTPVRFDNMMAYRRLKDLFLKNRYDLIHVHTPTAAFIARRAAKVTRQGPIIYTAHGFHFYRGAPKLNWYLYYNMERLAKNWTDGLIVINEEDFCSACRMGFEPGKNLFHVHGVGVDTNYFVQATNPKCSVHEELGIDRHEPIVSCIAEFNANKNHGFLLDAWTKLTRSLDKGYLLLVGEGKLRAPLERRVQRERIGRVRFLGYRNDIKQILSESAVVTLASKREGLPKCLMEAMAAGRAVVATNVRGSRELVDDGRTGFLVDLFDAGSYAEALGILLKDEHLQSKMGQAGRKKILNYSLHNVLKEMANIYGLFIS